MTVGTLVGYLVGQSEAILDVAANPLAPLVGLLFVISATFAREYDGADLRHEPVHLVLPLGASIASSLLLFLLVRVVAHFRDCPLPDIVPHYWSFLGLYWMTAPLAWLYAIPVERWMSPVGAARANLCLLAIVSLWRVLLITRVVSVVFQATFGECFVVVMLFADSLLLAILYFTPVPLINMMGGVRLSPRENVIQAARFLVQVAGVVSWPVWVLGTVLIARGSFGALPWTIDLGQSVAPGHVAPSVWLLAIVSVLVWVPLLRLTQPQQQLRWRVEQDLRSGRIAEAVALMSSHTRAEFPPHWDPPPRLTYANPSPSLAAVLREIVASDSPDWLREIYVRKLTDNPEMALRPTGAGSRHSDEELALLLNTLEQSPAANGPFGPPDPFGPHAAIAEMLNDESRPAELRDGLRALLKRGEKPVQD